MYEYSGHRRGRHDNPEVMMECLRIGVVMNFEDRTRVHPKCR